jgi:hypothetical protein
LAQNSDFLKKNKFFISIENTDEATIRMLDASSAPQCVGETYETSDQKDARLKLLLIKK